MEKIEALRTVMNVMSGLNIDIDSLAQAFGGTFVPREVRTEEECSRQFDFEVLYEDLRRSTEILSEVRPLGVVVCGYLLTLRDLPDAMNRDSAIQACAQIEIDQKACSQGSLFHFWEILARQYGREGLIQLNSLLEKLGGQPLVDGMWYWAEEELNGACLVFMFSFRSGKSFFTGSCTKHMRYLARPVWKLPEV